MIYVNYLQLLLFVVSLSVSEAKVFSRCELAKTLLKNYKFPRAQLADWVCLIESESGRNTAAVGQPNSNGSRDYGLFQINSHFACSGGPTSRYDMCKVSCRALTDDNISDDVKCAQLIFKRQGFNAWYGWKYRCSGKNVNSYIANCGL